jgi:hypothetical protein
MNARYGLAIQGQLQLRGEADAAYHPAGIDHARPAQKTSAKPATLLVFEMYARQKNLTRLQVSTYRRSLGDVRPIFCRKMFGALAVAALAEYRFEIPGNFRRG